ncbi:antibiotic biosynthesis monooxygenase [Polaromonas sp. P1(28)-13]|nr:antibiotic biosynthesis monooxygenase [Polaromonas sp. P1(28)-13]
MSTAAADNPSGAVTVLITRSVMTGHEQAFEQAMGDLTAAASAFPGYLGGQLVLPDAEGNGGEPNLYHVVFAFDSPEHQQGWQQSPTRSLGLAAIAPHIEGQTWRQVSGLGHWFASPVGSKQSPPPRWKVAVVTWLGICPTVYVLFLLLSELLAPWYLLPRVIVITALVVLIMTWAVAPQLTKLLKAWLYPATRNSTQKTQ